MRSTFNAALVALAMLLVCSPGARAQDQDLAAPPPEAAAPAPAPAAGLPNAPIPYTTLHPKKKKKPPAKPRVASPKPALAAASPAAAPAAAPAPVAVAPPATPPVAKAAAPVQAPAPAPAVQPAPQPAPSARLTPAQPLPPAELEAFVDGVVKDAMAREHIAGVTVSVVQNGQVVLKKGYGFAGLKPERAVDPDRTLFRVGSISKTFTWIALMKEVEAGRIRLDRPVNLYLPERVQIRDQGYQEPVRVMNLLDHSGGFEDRALGQLFEDTFDRVRPLTEYLRQERPKRVHAPGEVSSYSNYGAALAGEAVTYVSGKPFERLIEEEILIPLGMGRTTFREPHAEKTGLPGPMPAALASDVSDGYRWTPAGFKARDYEYIGQIAPAGAASSTGGDMARYMIALLGDGAAGGVSLYGPRTAQAFRTPLRQTPPGINGWAHGFMVFDLPGGHRGYGHGGDTISFHSNLVTVPDLKLGIFIAANTESGQSLVGRFPDRLVRQFYGSPQSFPRPGSPELVQDARAYSGHYLSTQRAYSGLEGFVSSLIGGASVAVTPEGRLTTATMEGVKLWVPQGAASAGRFIAADGDQRLAFVMDGGRARAYLPSFGGALMERTPFWRQPGTLAVLAGLTAAAALATLVGIFLRNRREFRENTIQARGALIQNIQGGLWLASMALFLVWVSKTGDIAKVMYRWPGALLITASACALVAAGLTITTLVALPAIWRGGRRVDSWTHLRKAFFTITVIIYALFSLALALWGALMPWSG